MALEFGILGPLEVRDGDRRLEVRGGKQRVALAMLLLHANEVVSTDALIDAIWGTAPPEGAVKALQMHISHLRKVLRGAGEVIVTRPAGYQLRVAEGKLDLHRFERALDAAHAATSPQEASRALREALGLWRGPALGGLEDAASLRGDVSRLEEMRLRATEERVEAELAMGRHDGVVGELRTLVAAHPLRERLRAQLMLALYRSGRQAEALEVYRDARSVLVGELGIEPGRELRELEGRILAQDPGLEPHAEPAAEPRPKPAPARDSLVGRRRELAELLPVVDGVLAGSGAMVLVAGEPGIGKTRLAEAVASHARGRGAAIAIGRSWEAGGAPPYWPWIQALGSYARDLEPEVLAAQLGHDAQTLAAILPAAGAAAPEPPRDPGEQGRFRLFSAVAGFLRRAAAAQPLALFLDDLHAADPPSLVLLRFVAAELAQSRILILGSFRDTDVGSALAAALPDLAREGTVHRIVLGGLSATETARLLERITGTPPAPAIVDRVQERGAGNPLFAVETGRLLAAGKAGEDLPIPVRITEAIALRVRARSEPCRTLLALASVVGREFGVDLLARASTLPEDELLEALEEAERARLVGPVPAEGSRLRFSHILVRDTLYESIPAARRLRLHRRVAEALEALHAGHPDPYLAELAHHYLLAGPASAGKAAHYATRAGDRAAALHAYEAAARHFGTALRVLEASGAGDASAVSALLVSRGDALSRGGSEEESKADLRHAAALAEEHDLPGRLAGAALAYGGRFTWIRGCADPALVPLLERALAATGGERAPPRARLLARLAAARRDDSRREERVALAREALDIASEHDDPMTLATALEGYWNAAEGPDNVEEGWALTTQLVALAEVVGDKERLYMARDHRLNVMWRSCDRAGIDVEIVALGLLADELRQPAQRWAHATVHSMLALMEGRFEEAEELISDAYTQGHPATRWNAAVSQRLSLFVLRREQGRLAEVEDTLRRSVHEYPTLLRFPCALAHLHAELGRADEARALSGELLGRDLAHEHVDAEWLFSLSLLADPCAFLADADGAARLRALLRPFEHLYAHAPVEAVFGCVARALGVLATTTGDFDDAEHHFAQALAIERRMRARPWLAHAQHDLAAMRVARGDRDAAAAPLGAARSAYDDLGMTAWATRAAALATA